MKNLFGISDPDLFFDVMVHFGTLIPVVWIFREDLLKIIRSFFALISHGASISQLKNSLTSDAQVRLIGLIVAASVPTALIGFFFKDLFEHLFSSVLAVGVSLLITGTLLQLTKYVSSTQKTIKNMTFFDAAVIGFFQALAITPGISRSGTTISTALFLGIDRELAGRFSFLILIPALLGAMLLNCKLPELHNRQYFSTILVATAAAAFTGYFALKVLLRFLRRGKLYLFSPYCYGVGLLGIILAFLR